MGGSHTINTYFTNTGPNTSEIDAYDAADASSSGGFPYSSGPLATRTLNLNPSTSALSSGSPLSFTVPNGKKWAFNISNRHAARSGL